MINLKKYTGMLLAVAGLTAIVSGCVKDTEFFESSDDEFGRRQTVRIADGGADAVQQRARDLAPTIDTFLLLEVRRSPNSEAELNQPLTVKVVRDTSIIGKYNRAHGGSYVELPTSAYQVLTDLNNVTFQPGEFSKAIRIRLDKNQMDLSKQYALGLRVTDASGGALASAEQGEVLYSVGVKNQYHGTYSAVGTFTHPTAGVRAIDEDKELQTWGATTVRAPLGDLGGSGYYMLLTVNPDNTVTVTPSGATPNIDQSWGPNFYDPATKSFHLHYSYNVSAPRIVQEVITRK